MRVARADFAATVPWNGILDRPDGPDGTTSAAWGHIVGEIGAQRDLTTALGRKANSSAIARVGFTGSYRDLTDRPMLGSAATANVPDFASSTQGALADSATQPGDNVSTLANDATYQSAAAVAATVASALAAFAGTTNITTIGTLTALSVAANGEVLAAINSATAATATGSQLDFGRSRGTLASPADVTNGDKLAVIRGRAYSGGTMFATAEIDFRVDGTFTTAQRPPSAIDFFANAANSAQVRMAIIDSLGFSTAGRILTATPSVGAAGAWKLGKFTAGVAAQAGKVRVNIDGTDYDLLTA